MSGPLPAERPRTTGEGTAGWHPAVEVTAPDGTTAQVDTHIADLVLQLWADGFTTVASCQSARDSGWAWVRFANAEQAHVFAGLVAPDRRPEAQGLNVTFRRARSLRPDRVMRASSTDHRHNHDEA